VRAIPVALLAALTLLLAGCSQSTTSIPRPTPGALSATRSYLVGPGSGLLHMNSIASTISISTTESSCRSEARALVELASGMPSDYQLADQQLAELLSDEGSALAEVLVDCVHRAPNTTALTTLAAVHSDVNSRLRSDGVTP
jgi:hypothetical protein